MEFKSLKNIETAFKYIRFTTIIIAVCLALVTVYSVYSAYDFAEKQRQKIYVLDEGKSLMLALSQNMEANRPVELREHIRKFHELFFTLAPDKQAIESNINRALVLADKSAYHYYKDLAEKGYYNRIISGGINQSVQVDSIVCKTDSYPYVAVTYARQLIIRESNITERSLITKCTLINTVRSDANPQGCYMENFEVVENRDIRTVER